MSVAPARRAAFTVLRRVFEDGSFADRALHSAAADLSQRDRALATVLVYGTVQRKRTLDHILSTLVTRRLEGLDPAVLAALRLGLFQIVLLGGVSDYAAVNESVELAKASSKGGAQMVNAVLRRATREGQKLLDRLDDRTALHAAVLHSVPDWLAELWWSELGADEARTLLRCINRPAENALRVNTLKADRATVMAALPPASQARPAAGWGREDGLPEIEEGLVLSGAFDAYGSELWQQGRIMPQSRASMLVARVLDPQPGERVLDLCAAPGGKTTHLLALMGGEGELIAVEVHPGRARALHETCELMGAGAAQVITADARSFTADEPFDRVLVDPPCSGLGTLQSRPDLRWAPRRGELGELAGRQAELLHAAAAQLKPGGCLVYSVCTISRAEGEAVVDAFLAERGADFVSEGRWQLLPSRDGTDGFFLTRLRHRGDGLLGSSGSRNP
jgi:16S rRNA (cytosine967-C5)-methyltransferase